jgi:hypothetical protein
MAQDAGQPSIGDCVGGSQCGGPLSLERVFRLSYGYCTGLYWTESFVYRGRYLLIMAFRKWNITRLNIARIYLRGCMGSRLTLKGPVVITRTTCLNSSFTF